MDIFGSKDRYSTYIICVIHVNPNVYSTYKLRIYKYYKFGIRYVYHIRLF